MTNTLIAAATDARIGVGADIVRYTTTDVITGTGIGVVTDTMTYARMDTVIGAVIEAEN